MDLQSQFNRLESIMFADSATFHGAVLGVAKNNGTPLYLRIKYE